jgi:hypothetical protein
METRDHCYAYIHPEARQWHALSMLCDRGWSILLGLIQGDKLDIRELPVV